MYSHRRNLQRICLLRTCVFIKCSLCRDILLVCMKKRLHQSVTDWDSTDGGFGAPRCSGAVHWCVNYDPVSLCGLVALPRQSLTCSPGVFHFKTTILLRSRSNRAKVRGYCAARGFIVASTAAAPLPPSLVLGLLIQTPCFTHTHTHPYHTSLWLWQDKCAPPLMCPLVWNAYLCSKCKLPSEQARQHHVPCLLITA